MNIPDIIICSPEENGSVSIPISRTIAGPSVLYDSYSAPSTPSFRMKGARYSLLYQGHLPKQEYHDWFLRSVLPKKQGIDTTIFIGHIRSANMTRVIFKLNNYNIDWKSPVKFNYKLGDAIYRPEIKVIYKTQFHKEYNALIQQDPYAYPPLTNPNIISIRSPTRYKMIPLTPVVQPPVAPIQVPLTPVVQPPVAPIQVPLTPVVQPPVVKTDDIVPIPAISTIPIPAIPNTDDKALSDKIKTILEEMGIVKILAELTDIQRNFKLSTSLVVSAEAPEVLDNRSRLNSLVSFKEVVLEQFGIYIEGEACDFLDSSKYSYILENKSIIKIVPIDTTCPTACPPMMKNPIFITKNDFAKTKEMLQKYGVWFETLGPRGLGKAEHKSKLLPLPGQDICPVSPENPDFEKAKLILKNTDLMILGLL